MPNAATRPLFEKAAQIQDRLLSRLRGADARRPSLQHRDPRRPRRQDRRQIPQGAPARPCRVRQRARVPASGEALLRTRQPRLSGMAHDGRHLRHGDLQRPPLARDLSRDGPAGRRDGRARLQHAVGEFAEGRRRAGEAALPPQSLGSGRRLPERHLRDRDREMRRRGRPPAVRRKLHRQSGRRDHRERRRPRTTNWSSRRSISTTPSSTRKRSSTSRATAASSTMGASQPDRRDACRNKDTACPTFPTTSPR